MIPSGVFAIDFDAERILIALTRYEFKVVRVLGAPDNVGFELTFMKNGIRVDIFS